MIEAEGFEVDQDHLPLIVDHEVLHVSVTVHRALGGLEPQLGVLVAELPPPLPEEDLVILRDDGTVEPQVLLVEGVERRELKTIRKRQGVQVPKDAPQLPVRRLPVAFNDQMPEGHRMTVDQERLLQVFNDASSGELLARQPPRDGHFVPRRRQPLFPARHTHDHRHRGQPEQRVLPEADQLRASVVEPRSPARGNHHPRRPRRREPLFRSSSVNRHARTSSPSRARSTGAHLRVTNPRAPDTTTTVPRFRGRRREPASHSNMGVWCTIG